MLRIRTILSLLFLTTSALAQTNFGRITGTVTDSSGAVTPGAKVSVWFAPVSESWFTSIATVPLTKPLFPPLFTPPKLFPPEKMTVSSLRRCSVLPDSNWSGLLLPVWSFESAVETPFKVLPSFA